MQPATRGANRRRYNYRNEVLILLSPLSGDEGSAVKSFAESRPELTFVVIAYVR